MSERLLAKLLLRVQEACLYAEDDGVIGVTEEPHIDEWLFGDICRALNAMDVATIIELRRELAHEATLHV